jgi:hypothetical protein
MKARNALKILRYVDSMLNKGKLTDAWGKFLYARAFSEYDKSYELRLLGNYKIHDSLLARISSKCGTDKGGSSSPEENYVNFYHTYTDFYELLFSNRRNEIHLVFECGIGSNDSSVVGNFRFWNEKVSGFSSNSPVRRPGGSLRMWEEYFPLARIFGADIDSKCLFQEGRISTFQMDQTDPHSVKNFWTQVGESSFDLMIDDGLHEFRAGKCLFENSFENLRVGGFYVIEDVVLSDLISYRDYFKEKPVNVFQFSMQRTKLGLQSINHNSLVVIQKL